MTREEAMAAAQELAASPAAGWVGTGVQNDGRPVIKCMRCGAEDSIAIGDPSTTPAGGAPPGIDDKIFAWARTFHKKHESCVEAKK